MANRLYSAALAVSLSTAMAQVTFDPYSKVPPQHSAAEILEKAIHALDGVKAMEYEVRILPEFRSPPAAKDSDVTFAGRTKVIGTPGAPIQYRARFVAEEPKTVVLAVSNGDKVRISEEGTLTEYPTRVMEDEASIAALPTLQMFDAKRLRKALDAHNAIYAGRDDVEGELCYIVGIPSLFEDEDGSDTDYVWFSASTGLPKSRQRFRIGHGKTRTTYRWLLSDIHLNPEISPETFKYHPTAEDSTPAAPAPPTPPAAVSQTAGPKAGEAVPEIEVRNSDYKPVSLKKAVEGKATIVTLWAPWCGPCVHELAVFEKLVERYAGRLQIIALGVDDSRIALNGYAKKHPEFRFTFVTDPHLEESDSSKVQRYFGGLGIPRNLYVNPDGTVFDYAHGYDGKEDGLIKEDRGVARTAVESGKSRLSLTLIAGAFDVGSEPPWPCSMIATSRFEKVEADPREPDTSAALDNHRR